MASSIALVLLTTVLCSISSNKLIERHQRKLLSTEGFHIRDDTTGCYLAVGEGPIGVSNDGYGNGEYNVFYDCSGEGGNIWRFENNKILSDEFSGGALEWNMHVSVGSGIIHNEYNAKYDKSSGGDSFYFSSDGKSLYSTINSVECALQWSTSGGGSYNKWTQSKGLIQVPGKEAKFDCNGESPDKFTIIPRMHFSGAADAFDFMCAFGVEKAVKPFLAGCPSGYTDYGLDCIETCGSGYKTNIDQLSCSKECGSGYEEIGHSCTRAAVCWTGGIISVPYLCADVYMRDTYIRKHQPKATCADGLVLTDLSESVMYCFGKCPERYVTSLINNNIKKCKCEYDYSNMVQFLTGSKNVLVSSKSQENQCISSLKNAMSEFFDYSIGIDKLGEIAKNPQKLYEIYKDAIDIFYSCITSVDSKINNRRRLSFESRVLTFEIGIGGAGIGAIYGGFGVVIAGPYTYKTKTPKRFYTTVCTGFVTDLSIGAYMSSFLFEDYATIPGTSQYLSIGADVPPASVDVTIVWNDDSVIGGGISLGAEIGLSPIDIGWGGCLTSNFF